MLPISTSRPPSRACSSIRSSPAPASRCNEALLIETGLEFDRAWMVVDAAGEFVTQRELPRMALIRPQLKHSEMVLRAPGMLALHIAFDRVEAAGARDASGRTRWRPTTWATSRPSGSATSCRSPDGRKLRLVRFDPEQQRLSSLKMDRRHRGAEPVRRRLPAAGGQRGLAGGAECEGWWRPATAAVGIERFRPNIVLAGIEAHDEDRVDTMHIATAEGEVLLRPVKPCARCPIPDIDPATGSAAPKSATCCAAIAPIRASMARSPSA